VKEGSDKFYGDDFKLWPTECFEHTNTLMLAIARDLGLAKRIEMNSLICSTRTGLAYEDCRGEGELEHYRFQVRCCMEQSPKQATFNIIEEN